MPSAVEGAWAFDSEVVSIIRHKDKSADDRLREIGNLMRGWQQKRSS
jgi:hypothetical protein